jgi:hypothetical protein
VSERAFDRIERSLKRMLLGYRIMIGMMVVAALGAVVLQIAIYHRIGTIKPMLSGHFGSLSETIREESRITREQMRQQTDEINREAERWRTSGD